ncbi:MAG: class IV adenylate cyclase [Planctomycetales bacterium]|nr:class IV adenylate cyclase [Planctomycetales bacterium]
MPSSKMDMLEVEIKFRLADPDDLVRRVEAIGGHFGDPVEQADTYFAHPQRNFAETDEALRIRRSGKETRVTYKGPKIDTLTKTRLELELPIHDFDQHAKLFELLGFQRVATVRKQRRTAHLRLASPTQESDWSIEVCWDEVDGLGAFVELETTADESNLPAARQTLLDLAAQLELRNSERRGYLDMLLE